MGSNLARNFARNGNTVAVYNRSPERTRALIEDHGSEGNFIASETVEEFVASLERPRKAIIMVQAGAATDAVINQLADAMEDGDIIIDGGNALYTDTIRREKEMAERNRHFVGAGISGGEEGALNGPSIMPGGPAESWKTLGPILESIAAVVDGVPCVTHIGPDGAGHFVKMVHNGIEYGLMQAYAEGYELLDAYSDLVEDPGAVLNAWRRGTVVRSWLLDLMVAALEENPDLDDVSDYTADSGEGRWTVEEGIANAVPMPVISASLFARFASRQQVSPAMQAVAALRGQFGGHQVMTVAEGEDLRAEATKGVASPGSSEAQEEKKVAKPSAPEGSAKGDAAAAGPTSGTESTGGSPGPTSGTGATA